MKQGGNTRGGKTGEAGICTTMEQPEKFNCLPQECWCKRRIAKAGFTQLQTGLASRRRPMFGQIFTQLERLGQGNVQLWHESRGNNPQVWALQNINERTG
ncbi:hypothetical protein AA100600_2847 [Gluconobacter thailandicus F149-1 = NBRC 100600]|nr:hypothetical protein AA100600_2847 [Gluconobacter thailandicus F149-1 = NBRC 100600]